MTALALKLLKEREKERRRRERGIKKCGANYTDIKNQRQGNMKELFNAISYNAILPI